MIIIDYLIPLDSTRLEIMTVIHNFDTRGMDGKTPAERLFGNKIKFQSLFDYILNNFDDLPRPRKRSYSFVLSNNKRVASFSFASAVTEETSNINEGKALA